MRPIRNLLTPLALAIALGSAGCGGGEGEETDAPASAAQQGPGVAQGRDSAKRGGANEHKQRSAAEPNRQGVPPSNEPLPAPTQGSKAAAPGVPTSKHGDNSIQRWGLEASDAERTKASSVVKRYLDARVKGDWGRVCSLLAAKTRREQSKFAEGGSCAAAMASFAADARTTVLREEADIEPLSLRVKGSRAFLIYRRPDGVFAMALTKESGDWKLFLLGPNPIS